MSARNRSSKSEKHTWGMKHNAAIAEQVLRAAKELWIVAAYVALVGLCLEAQTLPGEKAERLLT